MESQDPISIIAHKIRTPLTVIMSTVNNLVDGAFGNLNATQVEWLKKRMGHTASLEELLNQILTLLKENSGNASVVGEVLLQQHDSVPAPSSTFSIPSQHHQAIPLQAVILVVDDEVDVQDVVREGLGMQGYTVLAASNAEEGYQLAIEKSPDVILMDLYLKDQNGLDVAQRIKKSTPSFVPVVMITGQDDLRGKIEKFQQQADDLLAKPFQISELTIRVSSMLRLKKLSDQLQNRPLV